MKKRPSLEYGEDIECRSKGTRLLGTIEQKLSRRFHVLAESWFAEKQSSPQRHIKETTLVIIFHVLDLKVGLRVLKMVPNDCPCPKAWVSIMFQKQSYKVTYLAILRGMIFPTHFLTPPKNDENGQKSKN